MLPLQKGGDEKSFSPFHPLKRGGGGAQQVLPCQFLDPQFSHFIAPLPVINDQSLGVLLVIIGHLESWLFM